MFRFHSVVEKLPIDPVFSNFVNLIKKSVNHNFFLIQRALRPYILFEIPKLKFSKKQVSFS